MSLFAIVMALLPKVGPALAATKEFRDLVDQAKSVAEPHNAETLDRAYDLACDRAEGAFEELEKVAAEALGQG